MSVWKRRTANLEEAPGIAGVIRFARPEDRSLKSLKSGEIALLDQPDLSRDQAELLVQAGVRAVVNAAESSTGGMPNLGPTILAQAGITIVDRVGQGIWTRVKSGDSVRIDDGKIFKGETVVAEGQQLDDAAIAQKLRDAEQLLATRLASLTANATDQLQREYAMLLEGQGIPRLDRSLQGRPVVVVSRSYDHHDDLKSLRRWIREHDPVLIGVADGADVLLDAGLTPHVALGHLDDLSDRALREVSQQIVATSASGRSIATERLDKVGREAAKFIASGSAVDLAILLAHANEARVIVQVGGPKDLQQFLERPPTQVAGSFIARLRAGSTLVDARSVEYFNTYKMPIWPVLLLLLAGIIAVAVAVGVTPVGQDWFGELWTEISDLPSNIKEFFS